MAERSAFMKALCFRWAERSCRSTGHARAYERGIREHPRGKLVLGVLGDGGMSGARHG